MNVIELHDVCRSFGARLAVDRLDLTIAAGRIHGFIGPNGSGKTTTIRMILRVFAPDRGQVIVFGKEHGEVADDRIGYLPEERGLYKKMRVHDVIKFFADLKGSRHSQADIDDWLRRFSLADRANHRVESLSKGMAQKVQFIAAVIARPELLILDEPFSGLDPVNRELFKDAILDLKRGGMTVLFSTHDMSVAEQMCDSICMIHRGRKVLDGPLDEVRRQYGEDTIRVRTGLTNSELLRLDGVMRINDLGRMRELRMRQGADVQSILRNLVQAGPLEHFELGHPTLHDIFLRIAGDTCAQNECAQNEGGVDG
ncbi:MAG: ATP-binding cassette domain-containing protein [Planctomycetes bacterium]|nr:ATP-binding cassette domain-containing protein [Planctomycetota bacterium]